MKLGDIKAEALRLMFVNFSTNISAVNITQLLNDETYASYLVNMNGSINRGLERVAGVGKLGIKYFDLPNDNKDVNGNIVEGITALRYAIHYDLSKLLNDYYFIERIIYEDDRFDCKYDRNICYELEGKILILPKLRTNNEHYRLLYNPSAPYITKKSVNGVGFDETDELPIPERIARLLPYYIKGELYEEEEPSAASNARNIFEQTLAELKDTENTNVNQIKTIYGVY